MESNPDLLIMRQMLKSPCTSSLEEVDLVEIPFGCLVHSISDIVDTVPLTTSN